MWVGFRNITACNGAWLRGTNGCHTGRHCTGPCGSTRIRPDGCASRASGDEHRQLKTMSSYGPHQTPFSQNPGFCTNACGGPYGAVRIRAGPNASVRIHSMQFNAADHTWEGLRAGATLEWSHELSSSVCGKPVKQLSCCLPIVMAFRCYVFRWP